MKTDMIEVFLNALEAADIDYVHWKSNTNIEKALIGEDDLDILVNPKKKNDIYKVLNELNIIRGYSEKDSWQNEIFHYFGMDIYNKKLVHIHLHFLLEVGYDFDKSVNLPIVEKYIKNKIKYKSIYIPEVEKEYILLIIRLLLKNALTPFVLMLPTAQYRQYKHRQANGVVTGSAYREFTDLYSRIDRKKLENVLKNSFPFISKESFEKYEKVIKENNSFSNYFAQAKELKIELKKYSYHSKIKSFLLAFYRINKGRINILIKNKTYFKKIPKNGGRIFAFIGGDGAGKSTNIEKLQKIMNRHFYTQVIHIGRPAKKIVGTCLRILSKSGRLLGLTELASAVGYMAIAYDRKKAFQKALKIRNEGGIVLLDRIPIEGITAMDCPRIHTLSNGKYKWLSKLEKQIYSGIKDIDELIVLRLNPHIALERRPEDNPEELLIRSGQIWEKDFSSILNAHIIDTSKSFEIVERKILEIVWQSICKKDEVYELLGLAGSGKSTLKNVLEIQKENYVFNPIPTTNRLFLVKKLPMAIYIFFKTKHIIFVKGYAVLEILLKSFTNRIVKAKKEKVIFDQGGIYTICLLIKDIPEQEKYFIEKLKKLLLYYDKVIYLETPINTLISRIDNREQSHRIKGKSMEEQRDFLEQYEIIFDKVMQVCYEEGVPVIRINTKENNIESVEKLVLLELEA